MSNMGLYFEKNNLVYSDLKTMITGGTDVEDLVKKTPNRWKVLNILGYEFAGPRVFQICDFCLKYQDCWFSVLFWATLMFYLK
jgi:hypothetical protein